MISPRLSSHPTSLGPVIPETKTNELAAMLKSNFEKIVQHGQPSPFHRQEHAASFARRTHGRAPARRASTPSSKRALNLAYHGARAEKPGFNVKIDKLLDPEAGEVELHPQEFTRVLLNLISNDVLCR